MIELDAGAKPVLALLPREVVLDDVVAGGLALGRVLFVSNREVGATYVNLWAAEP